MVEIGRTFKRLLGKSAALVACLGVSAALLSVSAKRIEVTSDTVSSRNDFVEWRSTNPGRINVTKRNGAGLSGSEPNLTTSRTAGNLNPAQAQACTALSFAPPTHYLVQA